MASSIALLRGLEDWELQYWGPYFSCTALSFFGAFFLSVVSFLSLLTCFFYFF